MSDDTTWFWKIVDARGLADVSSDEFVALNELISKAERAEAAEALVAQKDEQLGNLDRCCEQMQADAIQWVDRLHAAEARATAAEAERDRAREALEWISSEIEGERNLITHPHGRRAHHIDSQDEIRVEVLTGLLASARAALSTAKERGE